MRTPRWPTARSIIRHLLPTLGAGLTGISSLIAVTTAAEVSSPQVVRVSGPHLQVGVDKMSGRIVELIDQSSWQNFASPSIGKGGLWELEFAEGHLLSPTKAHACNASPIRGKPGGMRLEWSQFGLPQSPQLRVQVVARLDPNQGLSRWQISLRNLNGQMPRLIRFPRLLDVPKQPQEHLAVPVWLGQQAENPRNLLNGPEGISRRLEWAYPGLLAMQCLALSGKTGAGLYAACDDTAGYLKAFAVFGSSNAGFNLEIIHRPENDARTHHVYELPYSVLLGAFQGDWFDAAALYRAWATNQSWAHESRLRRGLVPAWVNNTALWVWNRGPSSGVIDPAIALEEKLGLPVSVFWHWWHGCAYDAGFPEYLPPREGEAAFKAALQRAHASDVHTLVYMNQRLWCITTASWTNEHAERFAVKAADGQVKPEVYNTFTKSPCASMCMGTEFWRNKYAGLASTAFREMAVDGIYMDQACSSLACFDPRHGHAIGGGKYWMDGFKLLAADIRGRCEPRARPALAGEGCGENWLPHLDLMLALQVSRERYAGPDGWDTVPFFHAVYHGYGTFYGNYSSLTMPPYDELWPAAFAPKEPLKLLDRKFSRQFYLEQARAFVWGQQPTIANFLPSQLFERSQEIAFVLRLARVRRLALMHLQEGVMLAPPTVESSLEEIPFSRLSIYAGQRGGLKEFQKAVPQILSATWLAPDGSIAVALVNISDKALRPSIRLARGCKLPERGTVYRIDVTGRKDIGTYRGNNLLLNPNLAPLQPCLLELKRE